jgi:hypothetical protein
MTRPASGENARNGVKLVRAWIKGAHSPGAPAPGPLVIHTPSATGTAPEPAVTVTSRPPDQDCDARHAAVTVPEQMRARRVTCSPPQGR